MTTLITYNRKRLAELVTKFSGIALSRLLFRRLIYRVKCLVICFGIFILVFFCFGVRAYQIRKTKRNESRGICIKRNKKKDTNKLNSKLKVSQQLNRILHDSISYKYIYYYYDFHFFFVQLQAMCIQVNKEQQIWLVKK